MSARYVTSTGDFISPTSPCWATVMNVVAPCLIEILEQFMNVEDQHFFLGHGSLIAVEAVDHDCINFFVTHGRTHEMCKFAGRQLRRVYLFYGLYCRFAAMTPGRCRDPSCGQTDRPEFVRRK